MNKDQRNLLLMKTIVIDRNFGRVSYQQSHQDMMRIINHLTMELYETQKELKSLTCEVRGHDWETYTVSTGYWGNDIEQAGYCVRCGYDTHGEYEG
jgi:hypothetical protein